MKCRARNFARRRWRAVRGRGVGRGANGGAKNIEPKSAPSTAPSAVLPEVVKKLDVISVLLALLASPLDFFLRRATAMKREIRRGRSASAALRTKREADFAAWGTRLAICWISRPGSDCRKREPVSVRGGHALALRGPWPRHPCAAAHIRVQARWRAAHPRRGV